MFIALCILLYHVGTVFYVIIWYPLTPREEPKVCHSHYCFKIFTCRGMQDTTRHIREPFLLIGGLLFAGMGLHGSWSINHKQVKYFAYFLLATSVMYMFNLVADSFFMQVCGDYPSNVIYQTLFWSIPGFPIPEDKKVALMAMERYPVKYMHWFIGGPVWRWNVILSLVLAVTAFYWSHITMILSRIYIDGPIGLGVNYRLGAWRAEVLLKHRMEQIEHDLFAIKSEGLDEIHPAFNKDHHHHQHYGYGGV